MKNITAKRSRARIVDKLLALGLVAERRELYKKRQKKLAPSSLPNKEESLKDFCQEELEEEENLPDEESEEDEEKEKGSEEEEAPPGSSVFSAENLGQSLHQEGEDLDWEVSLRWSWAYRSIISFPSSLRLFCSAPMAPELPDSGSR